jgi:hypothetical protein
MGFSGASRRFGETTRMLAASASCSTIQGLLQLNDMIIQSRAKRLLEVLRKFQRLVSPTHHRSFVHFDGSRCSFDFRSARDSTPLHQFMLSLTLKPYLCFSRGRGSPSGIIPCFKAHFSASNQTFMKIYHTLSWQQHRTP